MDEEKTCYPETSHPYLEAGQQEVPVLKALSGALQEKAYELTKQEHLIGRHPASDIVIPDKNVSRRHAVVLKKTDEYLIQDLDSRNGVYVNNLKLEKTVLSHGDIIQIGSCVFQFIWQRSWSP